LRDKLKYFLDFQPIKSSKYGYHSQYQNTFLVPIRYNYLKFKEESMESTNHSNLVRSLFEEVYSKGNISKCNEILSKDVVLHDPALAHAIHGVAEFAAMETNYTRAFPGKKAIIEEMWSFEDRVVVRWRCQGIHKGAFNGILATNRSFSIDGISIYRFENKKIVEIWQNWDRLGLLEQLGAVAQASEITL
jgi:steroid delta-isomerase-like uncharacterized protein